MTSYRRFGPRRPDRAGEGSGVYEINPLDEFAAALADLEEAKRRALDRFEDVVAWGGTAQTTGYTQSEWMALVAGTKRLSGDLLAEVEREAAHVALSRNQRGDDPDRAAGLLASSTAPADGC